MYSQMPGPHVAAVRRIQLPMKADIGLLVVTENEWEGLRPFLRELVQTTSTNAARFPLYYGKFGPPNCTPLTAVVAWQPHAGSGLAGGSQHIVDALLSTFSVRLVAAVGVAFGWTPGIHRLGDILVSDAILPYENIRQEATHTTSRNPLFPLHQSLASAFLTLRASSVPACEVEMPDVEPDKKWEGGWVTRQAEMHRGTVITGPQLIDNVGRKEEIKQLLEKVGDTASYFVGSICSRICQSFTRQADWGGNGRRWTLHISNSSRHALRTR